MLQTCSSRMRDDIEYDTIGFSLRIWDRDSPVPAIAVLVARPSPCVPRQEVCGRTLGSFRFEARQADSTRLPLRADLQRVATNAEPLVAETHMAVAA